MGEDGVVSNQEELLVYECDAYTLEKHLPNAVVLPRTTEQVVAIVKLCARHNLPFIPRGAGIFGSMFPWSLPAFAMAPVSPHRVLAMTLGLLGGVAIAGVACWDLSRREQR